VSLLLGRVERLDTWAEQFYDARSDVTHEGETKRPDFAPQKQKGQTDAAPYQSHLIYGRQIFQLCVGVVLFGASLGKDAGIAEKFITNEERLQFVCKTLDDDDLGRLPPCNLLRHGSQNHFLYFHRPLHCGLPVKDHASHRLLPSPPAKRTDHVLSQPDISCANDSPKHAY
jgi:hypothetical protein